MTSPASKTIREKLIQSGQELSNEVSQESPNKKAIAEIVKGIKEDSELSINELAELFQVSVQTLYRWMKDEGPVPRRGQISNFVERLKREPSQFTSSTAIFGAKTKVRIGVSKFWDMALITGFGLAFSALNIDPEFHPLDSWHDDAHEAFMYGAIEVAIHNHFSELYDKTHPIRSLGLVLSRPLFSYEGHHIFISREYLDSSSKNAAARNLSEGLLKEGLTPSGITEHKDLLRKLLADAYLGFERGTDLELAIRRAFLLAEMSFPDVGAKNLNRRRSDGKSISSYDQNPNLATTEEALEAFKDGEIDIFCGGWQQFYELNNRREIVLLSPQTLRVKSFNGIVTTEKFEQENPEVLRALEQVWFSGIEILRKAERGRASLKGEQARWQTLAELESVIRSAAPYTGGMTKVLFSNEDADQATIDEIKNVFGPTQKKTQINKDLKEALLKHRDRVSEEHQKRVFGWAELLCKYDSFYRSPDEAARTFKNWWSDEEVKMLWAQTQKDFVKGTGYAV
jgi:predicted DNA-binding transcriptional regulator AlpA